MSYPSDYIINSYDLYFLNSDNEPTEIFPFKDELLEISTHIYIEGQLYEPTRSPADQAISDAFIELSILLDEPSPTSDEITWAERALNRALGDLPARLERRHGFLWDIQTNGVSALHEGSDPRIDEIITQMESDGKCVKTMKHHRKIFRDGSLVTAIDSALMWFAIDIAKVLQRPQLWPGYNYELLAYVILALRGVQELMIEYHEKLKARGVDPKAARATNREDYQVLLQSSDLS